VKKHAAALGRHIAGIDSDAMVALVDYDYPGNVRELENVIERAVTLEPGERITRGSLPELVPRRSGSFPVVPNAGAEEFPDDGIDLERTVADFERDLLLKALDKGKGVRKTAAKLLNISFRSLRYRLAKLGVDTADGDGDSDDTPTT
jgi:two-component system response regulator PilR (NtrC family)